MKITGSKNLDLRRATMRAMVDQSAAQAHDRIVASRGPTRFLVALYLEALEFLQKYPTQAESAVAHPSEWLLLSAGNLPGAEMPLFDVATEVVAREKAYRAAAARIERIRLTTHQAIAAAATEEQIAAAARVTWPAGVLTA